jgi:hypothetical protein
LLGAALKFLAVKPLCQLLLLGGLCLLAPANPVITEFMADNQATLADEDGAYSDWIEIHNPTPTPLSLAGWKLTDNANNPTKWQFPAISLESGEFRIFFASEKHALHPNHTNFKLAAGGEYLALVRPDGTVAQEFSPTYPAQAADESYGLRFTGTTPDVTQTPAFFGNNLATPGWLNGAYSLLGKVADTQFSVKRGIFSAPISLTISTATAGATIRYTTDGSTPTASHGSIPTGPLTIAATTNLRAAAFLTGWEPTDVDTQTYLFPADIILQQPTGSPPNCWPATSGTDQVLDFGMDPEIVNHSNPDLGGPATVTNALLALPSVIITTDLPNYFNINGSQGFYANPYGRGLAWERPVSLEWINPPTAQHPNGTSEFQVNAGVRLRGGYSRTTDNPKHAFHLYFREDYGDAKLDYPLFGRQGAPTFDRIDFRTAQNYSWAFQGDARNTFLREEACRLAQLEMGHPSSHVRFVHLYLNGVYWGLYNLDERTEAAYSASYLGGTKEDYDVVNSEQDSGYITGVTDGSMAAWRDLWNQSRAHQANPTAAGYFKMMGKASDGVTPTADPVLLDVDNLIDYLMLTFCTGNLDGCLSSFQGNDRANNWFGSRRAVNNPGEGFRFYVHDFEHVFFSIYEDRTGPWTPDNQADFAYSNPYYLHRDLIDNREYIIRWADRIQKHLFQNGALTPTAWRNRINQLAAIVDQAIVAESARWGDAKSSAPFTKSHWLAAQNSLLTYVSSRHPFVLDHLRNTGLYSAIAAPQINPFGGYQKSSVRVTLSGPAGATLYYMSDGSDPRAVGGAIRPGAKVYDSTANPEDSPLVLTGSGEQSLRARAYASGTASPWSALSEAIFHLDTAAATPLNLAISEIMYHPAVPSPAEIAAGFTNPEDFEYLEILNTGTTPVDLRGLYIDDAVQFDFINSLLGTTLAPGGRLLLVANQSAFEFRFGSAVAVAGTYSGNLANSGETITLRAADDAIIRQVSYLDTADWPVAADGVGYSLVGITPADFSTDTNADGWRASLTHTGNPGGSDAILFPAWLAAHGQIDPAADPDGDGFSNLLEYAFGGSPTSGDQALGLRLSFQDFNAPVLTHFQRTAADSVVVLVESAADLTSSWTPDAVPLSRSRNSDGTETLVHRAADPTTAHPQKFWRLRVRLRP